MPSLPVPVCLADHETFCVSALSTGILRHRPQGALLHSGQATLAPPQPVSLLLLFCASISILSPMRQSSSASRLFQPFCSIQQGAHRPQVSRVSAKLGPPSPSRWFTRNKLLHSQRETEALCLRRTGNQGPCLFVFTRGFSLTQGPRPPGLAGKRSSRIR